MKRITEKLFEYHQQHPIKPLVVSDKEAVQACFDLADDHRLLVEPACGAALSAIHAFLNEFSNYKSVLIIVCGGIGLSLQELEKWQNMFSITKQ